MESDEALLDEAVLLFEEKMLPRYRENPEARLGSHPVSSRRKLLQKILCDARLIQAHSALFVLGTEGTRVLASICTTREVVQSALGTDPPALKAAHAFFEVTFRPAVQDNRDTWYSPGDRPWVEENEIRLLTRAGLLREKNGYVALGTQADLVMTQLKTSLDVLREWWAAEQSVPYGASRPSIQHNYHGPVGAVASGPNSTAHGVVNIGSVDASLHKLVELQDSLGDLSNDLWSILRRVRELELGGADLAKVKADVLELELESFRNRVKPPMHEHVNEVLKCVPGLAQAVLGAVSSGG